MPTTITRPTRTDDTGTPASPNNDGDIVDAGTLSELEDNIDAMWSGATQVFGGVISAETGGTHALSAPVAAGGNILSLRNTTDGSGNFAQIRLGNDVGDAVTVLNALATSWSSSDHNKAGGSTLECTTSAGLSLASTHASGEVRIYAAGWTKLATFDGERFALTGGVAGSSVISGVLTGSVNTTSQGTAANTDKTTLHSFTLPAGALATDGDFIRIHAAFSFAANNNTKTIGIDFGGTSIFGASAFSGTGVSARGGGPVITATVFRTGAATQKAHATSQSAPSDSGNYTKEPDNAEYTTPTETLSGAVTINIWGQNGTASASDVVAETSYVEIMVQ